MIEERNNYRLEKSLKIECGFRAIHSLDIFPKIILANKVPIDEEEIVDYMIEGISVKTIKHQAMMQQFLNKEAMLKAMEEITLYPENT